MPIIRSAKKALRVSLRKKVVNDKRMKNLRESVKEVKSLVGDKKAADAKTSLAKAYQAIDKAAKRGVIKKNTAARKKSRLSAMIKKVS